MRGFIGGDRRILVQDVAEFVDAFEQAVLGEFVDGKFHARPSGVVRVCFARSIFTVASGRSGEQAELSTSGGTTIGSSEFFSEFCLKMSAKLVLITARNPNCVSAHGACSRELPQPKLSPASRTMRALRRRLVEDEIGVRIALAHRSASRRKLLVETQLRRGLQEARRNNLVGIDVVDRRAAPRGFRSW